MNEIWKAYPKDTRYKISNTGKIIGVKGKELSQYPKKGYLYVKMMGKTCLVHRIIAETFLENWSDNLTVDHINGIRTDNRVENLQLLDMITNRKKADENNVNVFKEVRYYIEKYGYEIVKEKLKELDEGQ